MKTPKKLSSKELYAQFSEGRDLWFQYIKLNGYAFEWNDEGIKKLALNVDLTPAYCRKCIGAYLTR